MKIVLVLFALFAFAYAIPSKLQVGSQLDEINEPKINQGQQNIEGIQELAQWSFNGTNAEVEKTDSSDRRPGTYFFYKLTDVSKFFQNKELDIDSAVFNVKGNPIYLTFRVSKHNPEHMGLFVCTYQKTLRVYYELTLVNINGQNDVSMQATHTLDKSGGFGHGRSRYITQNDVMNLGFVDKDSILMKVYVQVLN